MTTIKAVDVSRWQGRVTELQWVAVRHAEYELAIVGLWDGARHNPYARVVVEAAKRAGLRVAGYAAVASGWTGQAIVNQAVANVDIKDLEFLALDVELTLDSPKQLRNALIQIGHWNLRPVIYSSLTKWRTVMDDNTDFADVPLWDAHYVRGEDLPPWAPYGGWTGRVGLQYAANEKVDYLTADLNVFSLDWLDGSGDAVLDFDNSNPSTETRLMAKQPNVDTVGDVDIDILGPVKKEVQHIVDEAMGSFKQVINEAEGTIKSLEADAENVVKHAESDAEAALKKVLSTAETELKNLALEELHKLSAAVEPLADKAVSAAVGALAAELKTVEAPLTKLVGNLIDKALDAASGDVSNLTPALESEIHKLLAKV